MRTELRSKFVGANFFPAKNPVDARREVVSCAVLSVFVSGGKYILVYILMYLEYHTVVVLCQVFWFWREIVFGTYVLHTLVVLC